MTVRLGLLLLCLTVWLWPAACTFRFTPEPTATPTRTRVRITPTPTDTAAPNATVIDTVVPASTQAPKTPPVTPAVEPSSTTRATSPSATSIAVAPPTARATEALLATATATSTPTAMAVATATAVASPSPTATQAKPTGPVFGVEMNNISFLEGFSLIADAGAYWIRRSGIWWPTIESTKGNRNWGSLNNLEVELKNAAARNMPVVLVVKGTPAWAQARASYSCGPIKRENFSDFGNFLQALVTRYSAAPYDVKYFEIWNEPDIDASLVAPDNPWGCWGDQNDPYYGGGYFADMLKVVYPQIKAANPQAQVLAGGLLLDCNPAAPPPGNDCKPAQFLEGILRNQGAGFFDGVSFHAYDYYGGGLGRYGNGNWQSSSNTTGPVTIAKARFIKSVLGKYGASDKFLMNTESALLCDACTNDSVFETTKSYYVAQSNAAAMAEGLRANIWFSVLGWRNSGLLYAGLQPVPALQAYRFAASRLQSAAFVAEQGNFAGVKVYEFSQNNKRLWLLWSLDGVAHTVTLPSAPRAVSDVSGNALPGGASLTVTAMPVYVELD